MAGGNKYDWPPLLAPGRHYLSLIEVEDRFVRSFDGEARAHREKLFLSLEEAVQTILRVKLPCQLCLDGSFLTKKEKPSDIDIIVSIEECVIKDLRADQREVIDLFNTSNSFPGIDSTAFFNFPRRHEFCGNALDANEAVNGYGIEHSQQHLKGFVVLRLWETDVGLRICR